MCSIHNSVNIYWRTICVSLLFVTYGGWGMFIPPTGSVDIKTEPCILKPNNTGIPCVMYTIGYESSIRYLKGYQIYEEGADGNTIGSEICKIIDLSNVTKDQYQPLSKSYFILVNSEGGAMSVTIKALPLPMVNASVPSVPTAMAIPPSPQVYHPNLTVSVDYLQLNVSAVNVSLKVTPEVKDLNVMIVRVLRDQAVLQQLRVPVSTEYFTIGNLTDGKYSMQFIPEDTSAFGTKGPCLCYLGNETNCVPCLRYTSEISVVSNTVTESEGTSAATIAVVVVTLFAMAAILVVFLYILRRTGRLPDWLKRYISRSGNESDASTGTSTRKHTFTIQILYAYDHAAHNDSIKALTALLKTSLQCRVLLNGMDELAWYDTSNTSLSSQESYREVDAPVTCVTDAPAIFETEASVTCETDAPATCGTDIFLFVHSDWVDILVKAVQTGEVTPSDVVNQRDHSFLLSFNELCTSPDLRDRTVSLQFMYSSESSVIREPFLGVLFTLPDNTDALINHIRNRLCPNTMTNPVVNPTDKLNLASQINTAFMFQTTHRLWLKTKLFSLKESQSSDDSGVVVSRRRKCRPRSLRSRSADTMTCHECQSALSRRHVCEHCDQISGTRLRSNSCTVSFFPPDNVEDASVGFSILETRFANVNKRYVSSDSIGKSII
ncbi:uncharacterized protein LOC127858839 isoform X2 [Dreissena polymorpha]|uniref:uncharacterized protein LOC127858839 isoform X2 n=1 Tax=Dreissena polymorpha TaxID=45954 RepID=UPI002263BFE1|nr:uncharacterized protein LOC127858839 isoform X2 [Dreissena polymorpha]